MKEVIIVRGTSGSGKTTWVNNKLKELRSKGTVCTACSADNYFIKEGKYQFDPNKLDDAHLSCYRNFLAALQIGYQIIIVDNTNTQLWEMTPYTMLAKTYGYDIKVVRTTCAARTAAERNVHGVPAKSVESMYKRMQNLPKYWPKETIVVTE